MLEAFCKPGAEWVVRHGLGLRLKTTELHQIPRAWASFFVQSLEVASNQSQFIVQRCLGLSTLLRGEPIDLGSLISENIKYMANATQRACGNFCIINELCRRAGVPV